MEDRLPHLMDTCILLALMWWLCGCAGVKTNVTVEPDSHNRPHVTLSITK